MISVTGSGRIPPETAFFRRFPADSRVLPAEKSTGRWKQYFGWNFIVAGNEKIRQVPFTGFYPEVRGIRAGNQPESNVSLRNLAGKVRIAAGCQLKNTGFRGTLIKSFRDASIPERCFQRRHFSVLRTHYSANLL